MYKRNRKTRPDNTAIFPTLNLNLVFTNITNLNLLQKYGK